MSPDSLVLLVGFVFAVWVIADLSRSVRASRRRDAHRYVIRPAWRSNATAQRKTAVQRNLCRKLSIYSGANRAETLVELLTNNFLRGIGQALRQKSLAELSYCCAGLFLVSDGVVGVTKS